ncbi:MAG: sugar transferase [Pirellulales bacterium]|nr:sugar transferase [Pirellulales bacterium]
MAPANSSSSILTLRDETVETSVLLGELLDLQIDNPGLNYPMLAWKPFSTDRAAYRRHNQHSHSIEPQIAAGLEIVPAEGNRSSVYLAIKRIFDIVGAICLLVLLSPVMLTTFVVLMFTTRGKPLFRQIRLGHRGRPFTMYKFRSMSIDAESKKSEIENEQDGPIFKNRSDARITRIGRFLRVTSIDEMPQLFNVLAGHMALVGPRPPIGEEVAKYEPWQRRRLSVKPGLTCLWQVSGRSDIGFERWVEMDIWYVENQNFINDLKLFLLTPWSVLSRRGAY